MIAHKTSQFNTVTEGHNYSFSNTVKLRIRAHHTHLDFTEL